MKYGLKSFSGYTCFSNGFNDAESGLFEFIQLINIAAFNAATKDHFAHGLFDTTQG